MTELLLAAALLLVACLPLLLERYVGRLPEGPGCPRCRAVTRVGEPLPWVASILPGLGRTFRGECGRCGWRGRMRWRWARAAAGMERRS